MATIPYGGRSSLQYALGNRRNRLMADSAGAMAPAQADGSYSIQAPPNQGAQPAAQPISDIGAPIQSEIGRVRQEIPQAAQSYEADRMRQRDTLQQNMLGDIGASMSLAIPEIQNSLAASNLVESGAYPEALARRQAQLTAQMLPTLQNFDVGTFDRSSALPLAGLDTEQALRRASIQRDYGVSDMLSGQANQQALADKAAKQQELQALLGLVPSLIGPGGIGGMLGGGAGAGAGGSAGGAGGSLGGLGGILGGGGASQGGAGGGLLDSLKRLVGGSNAIGGGIGGGLGETLGQRMGIGSGWGGALGGALGGGGLGGALGGGLGGVFGDELGAGIGGAVGGAINKPVLDWWKNRNAIDLNNPNVFVGPQMPTGPSGQGYGDKALESLLGLFGRQQAIPTQGGYASNPLPPIFDFGMGI